jgi:hypothetical protein
VLKTPATGLQGSKANPRQPPDFGLAAPPPACHGSSPHPWLPVCVAAAPYGAPFAATYTCRQVIPFFCLDPEAYADLALQPSGPRGGSHAPSSRMQAAVTTCAGAAGSAFPCDRDAVGEALRAVCAWRRHESPCCLATAACHRQCDPPCHLSSDPLAQQHVPFDTKPPCEPVFHGAALVGALAALRSALRALGSDLVVRVGPADVTTAAFCAQNGVDAVMTEREVEARCAGASFVG